MTTPTDVVQYQYDGFGRRIAKTVNGITTTYVYDQEDILFEVDANGSIVAKYTHGPGIDEPISVDRDTNGDGVLNGTYYYQYDGLGSVTALTDSNGIVAQSYKYDSFGNIVQQTGNVINSYTYTAREWDQEAGLYFNRARYYDPNTGRFLTTDPIFFAGGVNFYIYATNDPINWIDPWGLKNKDSFLNKAGKFLKDFGRGALDYLLPIPTSAADPDAMIGLKKLLDKQQENYEDWGRITGDWGDENPYKTPLTKKPDDADDNEKDGDDGDDDDGGGDDDKFCPLPSE